MRKNIVGDYKITKLDRRYTGHQMFKYRVHPFPQKLSHFHPVVRESFRKALWWSWEQWGPSVPLHMINNEDDFLWTWNSEDYRKHIFFKGDEQLTLFVLSFSK